MVCYTPLTIRRVATISALFRAVRICLERPDVAEFLSVFAAVATKDNPEGSAVLAHWRFEFVSSTAVVAVITTPSRTTSIQQSSPLAPANQTRSSLYWGGTTMVLSLMMGERLLSK